jgi:hypothetical protein
MKARNSGKRRYIATGNRLGKREAIEQSGGGRQHGQRTAMPGNEHAVTPSARPAVIRL